MTERSETFFPRVYSVPCFDYIDENGKQRVTAIIAPIKLKASENTFFIKWACNRAEACKNMTCRYSKKERLLDIGVKSLKG